MGEVSNAVVRRLPAVPVVVGSVVIGGAASLICSPLVARTENELMEEASQVSGIGPDLVEWRADYLQDLRPGAVAGILARLHQRVPMPLLFTFRAPEEGGGRPVEPGVRLAILADAVRSGQVDLVDVELSMEPVARRGLLALASGMGIPMVVSAHDFRGTPGEDELLRILAEEQEAGAAVAKIATTANEPEDGLRLLRACARARSEFLKIPLVGIAMGAAGAFTRVVAPLFGVDMTFARAVASSAPGQMGIEAVREARRLMGIG